MKIVLHLPRRSYFNRFAVAKRNASSCGKAGFTLIEIMIVVLIIGMLLAIALPSFIRAREESRRKTCIGNLRKIEYAKDAYIMDRNLEQETIPTPANLWPTNGSGYIKIEPKCPSTGSYTINDGKTDPTCSFGNGHLVHGS